MTMNRSPWITTLTAALLLVGCAVPAPPPTDLSLSPEQITRSLNARKLTARGDPDAVYGLAMLKTYLQPALDRCRADGGQIEVLGRSQV